MILHNLAFCYGHGKNLNWGENQEAEQLLRTLEWSDGNMKLIQGISSLVYLFVVQKSPQLL